MIVAWEVHETESDDYASIMITKTCLCHCIAAASAPLVLHSDNGSAMKGGSILPTLQRLGVVTSFSRPGGSDDNPYSEAIFRMLKYRPGYPRKPFTDVNAAREWVHGFTHWYDEKHKHRGLKFISPGQRHRGEGEAILSKRKEVYRLARQRNPERWGSRSIRNWSLADEVWLNPDRADPGELSKAA